MCVALNLAFLRKHVGEGVDSLFNWMRPYFPSHMVLNPCYRFIFILLLGGAGQGLGGVAHGKEEKELL